MYLLSLGGLWILLFLGSLFSFLETASVAISEHRLISLASHERWANYALSLKRELDKVLIFSLFGNSLFNALVTTVSTILVLKMVGTDHEWVLSVVTLVVTLLIIIFSEAVPKVIASKSPLKVLRIIAIPLYYLFILIKPLVWLIDKVVYFITQKVGANNYDGTSLDELKAIIADKRSPFQDRHRSILLNSFELEELTVKEVVIPLRNVEMINLNTNMVQLRMQLEQAHHTRIVVYVGKLDKIIGYLHVKDVLSISNKAYTYEDLQPLIRKINYIPEFVPIIRQISAAQKERERIFMVVNEYGDNLGVACLEDMLEIVFGDFTTDAPHRSYLMVKESANSYIVDGATLIREFNESHGFALPFNYDAMSINGLIMKHLGTIPVAGICFRIGNVSLEVINVGYFWAERVRITRIYL